MFIFSKIKSIMSSPVSTLMCKLRLPPLKVSVWSQSELCIKQMERFIKARKCIFFLCLFFQGQFFKKVVRLFPISTLSYTSIFWFGFGFFFEYWPVKNMTVSAIINENSPNYRNAILMAHWSFNVRMRRWIFSLADGCSLGQNDRQYKLSLELVLSELFSAWVYNVCPYIESHGDLTSGVSLSLRGLDYKGCFL